MSHTEIEQPLLAYVVTSGDNEYQEVAFGKTNVEARRKGANALDIEFEEVGSCKREPKFDAYAPGPVPAHAMLAHGWTLECAGCGMMYDKGETLWSEPGDAECIVGAPYQDAQGNGYCCQACMMSFHAKDVQEARAQHAAIEAVVLEWPGASNIHPYFVTKRAGGYDMGATFALPGLQSTAQWSVGSRDIFLFPEDLQAYRKYEEDFKRVTSTTAAPFFPGG